jgi:hypothetical protein
VEAAKVSYSSYNPRDARERAAACCEFVDLLPVGPAQREAKLLEMRQMEQRSQIWVEDASPRKVELSQLGEWRNPSEVRKNDTFVGS